MRSSKSNVTIRQLTPADSVAVHRLAELDSVAVPAEPLLGAEVEGRLLAAMSIASGTVIADPFSRTAELRDLLELRSTQLHTGSRPVRGRLVRRHASAPAPAGQLMGLHPRAS